MKTDKICPMCGTELEMWTDVDYCCPNEACEGNNACITPKVWETLFTGAKAKEALKVATDALKTATEYLGNQNPLYEVEVMKLHIDLSNAVEKIESIMKGDK